MTLSHVEQALLIAAYFRGALSGDRYVTASCSEVINLSLFYTGDITGKTCEERFLRIPEPHLYDEDGNLVDDIRLRYEVLIDFICNHPGLIEGAGNLDLPADPSFTGCRLTRAGVELATSFIPLFPTKPEFPERPDRRKYSV
jgi:hypothetical protein